METSYIKLASQAVTKECAPSSKVPPRGILRILAIEVVDPLDTPIYPAEFMVCLD